MALVNQVTDLAAYRKTPRDWSQNELAEFYRVENALVQAGMVVSTERGLSDEGEPWFIFCRAIDHEPVVHFARIDGQYVIISEAFDGPIKGYDFHEMILTLLRRHRLNTHASADNINVVMHPAALLIAIVGVAFLKAQSPAKASESQNDAPAPSKVSVSSTTSNSQSRDSGSLQPVGDNSKAQTTDTAAWGEQAVRLAIASIASLTETELAITRDNYERSNAIASSLEVGVTPSHKTIKHQEAADGDISAFSSSQLQLFYAQAHEVQNFAIEPGHEALVTTALTLVEDLIKASTTQTSYNAVSVNSINNSHLIQSINNVPVPVLLQEQHLAVPVNFDVLGDSFTNKKTAILKTSEAQVSLTNSHAADPQIFVTLNPAKSPVFLDAQSFGGIISYEISLKSSEVTNSNEFLRDYNIQIVPTVNSSIYIPVQSPANTAAQSLSVGDAGVLQTQDTQTNITTQQSQVQMTVPFDNTQNTELSLNTTVPAPQQELHQTSAPVNYPNTITISLPTMQNVQGQNFASSLIQFIHEMPEIQVSVTTTNNYSFYNPADLSTNNGPLGEITLNFNDGSSISIIGQKAEIDSIAHQLI